jgi:dolichyl-diphosphooligosaccharide--protein glycosyltransferase
MMDDGWEGALRWMRDQTPALPVPLDEARDLQGCYGVLTSWDYGHWVAYLARRPVVASETLSVPTEVWFLGDEELQALALLRGDVRYVIVDARMDADYVLAEAAAAGRNMDAYLVPATVGGMPAYGPLWQATMLARLYEGDASGMSHFRLVYESPQVSRLVYRATADGHGGWQVLRHAEPADRAWIDNVLRYGAVQYSEVKILGRVAGAHLRGTAPAGSLVRATLRLRSTTTARTLEHVMAVRADSRGHWFMTVPWPSGFVPSSAVQPVGPWTVEAGGRSCTVTLVEDDVEQGRTVEVR